MYCIHFRGGSLAGGQKNMNFIIINPNGRGLVACSNSELLLKL
jgi:hypothetical protein